MKNPTLAVIAFPGNNCETETLRCAERNGFDAVLIRWNQADLIGDFDGYILPGGFSFEDRGRSGAIAAREPIFEALRKEAQKGKLILGICNGAQMVVESGLIPVDKNPLSFGLADNMRRDKEGHVLGTGYYNTWCYIKPEREDTAFTRGIIKPLHVPIAHGEGRFVSEQSAGRQALETSEHVAFRYSDEAGNVDLNFPINPNGSSFGVAAIVNKEGTIMAIMPHPERFPEPFDGDQIFQSMKAWIQADKSPLSVEIGDLSEQKAPHIETIKLEGLCLEKSLIITDNECFSVRSAAEALSGESINLTKSFVFEIQGCDEVEKILSTHLLHNQNKEIMTEFVPQSQKYLVGYLVDDQAQDLSQKLSQALGKTIKVRLYKAWDFHDTDHEIIDKILGNKILSNPQASRLLQAA